MLKVKIPPLLKSIFTTTLDVRISDINYGNHLGHDSLVSLLHEARVRFLTSLGFSELKIAECGLIITKLMVDYRSEAFYGNKIAIAIDIGEISKTSCDLYYQASLENQTKEIARAVTTMTFFDYQRSKIVKIPDAFLNSIAAYE